MIELPVLSSPERTSRRKLFWRSVNHLQNDPAYGDFTQSELMPEASGSPGENSRRQFIQIMGASMAMAGLAACRKPVEAIMPYVRKPEEVIPGIPMHYASGFEFRGVLRPIVVESTDGRPTKIEGNREHPDSTGSSSVFDQASLLGLYDPDRSSVVLRDGDRSDWDAFVRFAAGRHAVGAGERLAVVAPRSSSMALTSARRALAARYPNLRWVTYSADGDASANAMRAGYGRSLRTRYNFADARVILSLDADFLGSTDADQLHNTAGYSASRAVDDTGDMSRLYVAESGYSVTGGMADHRVAVRSAEISGFASAVARRLGLAVSGGPAFDSHPLVVAVAQDLRDAGSRGVVVAGDSQSERVSLIAAAINEALGAVGTTVQLLDTEEETAGSATLAGLVSAMRSGQVDTLVTIGCNPAYDAPADLEFASAMGRVSETVHVGLYSDETASVARWHVPMTHYLEAWGDGRSSAGTMSVQQPLIAPLYGEAHSGIEVLGLLASGVDRPGYDLVREEWEDAFPGDFESFWKGVLHDGFAPSTRYASFSGPLDVSAIGGPARVAADGIEVVYRLDNTVYDGAYANNAWLQELPDPATKVVWDNVAVMSPATAESLGLSVALTNGKHFVDRAEISVDGRTINLPVWLLPGVAENSVQLNLGYGREIASTRDERAAHFFDKDADTDIYGSGAVATGVGVNVAALRTSASPHFATGATVTREGGRYLVASTQDHGTMPDEGEEVTNRGLFRMATLGEYRANPHFVKDGSPKIIDNTEWENYPALWESSHPTEQDAYKDNPYYANQWAMVIDLNACTGCNSCTVACQAENNIQVVGKDQVSRGREMHWIRMDRYFVSGDGADDTPQMVLQPVPCMHCENAPCESVCPVAATVHSPDGTNQMIYNRCIGTRYCANNCPYKVRRYNFYNWTATLPESVRMAQNPNVTVRTRGVMEKCSYCIQRVREANKAANVEQRPLKDGEVVTACQQACPASAIHFGDLNNAESAVVKAKQNPRRYELLAELSVKPRTSYLGRIRNPNPRLDTA